MDIKKIFDNEAKEYDFTSRAVNVYFDEALDFLVNSLNINTNELSILDVCCGTGILTEKVAKKIPSAKFTGVDFSTGMLDIAKERLKNYNFDFVVSDVCDETKMKQLSCFDIIISSFGIHNIHGYNNKQKALNNIMAHLKKGGLYITCDILKGNTRQEQKHFDDFQEQWLLKTYSKEQTTEWMNLLHKEDEPETLEENFRLLKNSGLANMKLVWQKEFLAIWSGTKL